MSNIINKTTINKWNDDLKVNEKKHARALNEEAAPKKFKIPRGTSGRAPRAQRHTPDISELLKIMPSPKGGTQYTEYKESLKESALKLIASIEPNPEYNTSLKGRIANSRDIQSILATKFIDLDFIDNDWGILAATICAKYIENRYAAI